MERLIIVPIERLEERYSDQWWRWLEESLHSYGVKNYEFVGDHGMKTIKEGQFLDVSDTLIYKAEQGADIIRELNHARKAGDSVKLFFMDLWNPIVEMVGYYRDCLGYDVKISGMLHAGTWDPNDFLTRAGMEPWARYAERSWVECADQIIVATQYHRNLIVNHLKPSKDNIIVENFPCWVPENIDYLNRKEVIVFPHRLAPEKQLNQFYELEKIMNERYPLHGLEFVVSHDVCNTKQEYYDLLLSSKFVFSSALQETFGIAMQEGINAGCMPIAPRRLSYIETIPNEFLYTDLESAGKSIFYLQCTGYTPIAKFKYNQDMTNIVERIINL